MTSPEDRHKTALLVIDLQNGVVDGAFRRGEVVANVSGLLDLARERGVSVIWVQHSDDELIRGSDAWQYVPELVAQPDEPAVHKHYGDAFEGTDLEAQLAARGVGRLIVVGAETDACIRSTIHGAFTRGYDVTLVGDAHTAGDKTDWGAPPVEDVIAHTNLYWSYQAAPGRQGTVVASAQAAEIIVAAGADGGRRNGAAAGQVRR
ncbi:MAG: isochorismatase family protein [Cellulomonadaceae bacterium]